jgi:hypothetical protein
MSGVLALATGGCAVVLLVAGCGLTGSSPSPAASGSGSFSSYLSCLRQHGVNIPTARPSGGFGGGGGGFGGGGGGFGGGGSASQQARQACASLRPSGGGGFGGGGGGGGFASALAAFRSCMAAHGETIPSTRPTAPPTPEPSASASSRADRFLNGLNPDDPQVAAALQACQSKLPSFSSGGSAG